MSSENNENPFDDSSATLIYTEIENDNSIKVGANPLTEVMDRVTNLSLGSFSPRKDQSVISESSEADQSTLQRNDDQVYLQCFVDTIRSLQKKFNKILKNKFVHKDVIKDVFTKIQSGDSESAKDSLKTILDKKAVSQINYKEITNFIEITFPMLFKQIIDNLENLNMLKKDLCDTNKTILETFHDKNNQIRIVNEHISKFKGNISDIIRLPENETIEGFFKNITEIIKKFNLEIVNLKDENKFLKARDIDDLKKQLEEKKMTIKKLQAENVSFSEIITKLDTTNIKLKKECVILSNEYKKVVDSIKLKSTIIEKQKKILEVLQKQVGTKKDFPIDELKKKIDKLQLKLKNEENPERKIKIHKEIKDYEKRINDYENLQ